MRGEETQVLGVLAGLALPADAPVLIGLPGTHSKWVLARQGRIEQFHTFMTGEVFAALRGHTILGKTMQAAVTPDDDAFARGLEVARGSDAALGLLSHIFSTRTLGLTGALAPTAQADYLSGLLIGHEVTSLARAQDQTPTTPQTLVLCGEPDLCRRYAIALQTYGFAAPTIATQATATGLWQIALAAGLPGCMNPIDKALFHILQRCGLIAILRGVQPHEVVAIGLAGLGLMLMSGKSLLDSGSLAIATSSVAVVWNLVFNTFFERWEARQKTTGRSVKRRVLHAVSFELGLIVMLVPLIAWWLGVSLWQALVMDMALVVFFLVYTFAFNWAFDEVFGLPASASAAEQRDRLARFAVRDDRVPHLRGAAEVGGLGHAVDGAFQRRAQVVALELDGGEPAGLFWQVGHAAVATTGVRQRDHAAGVQKAVGRHGGGFHGEFRAHFLRAHVRDHQTEVAGQRAGAALVCCAGGVVLRCCVTLPDCLPNERPPPRRLAHTSCEPSAIAQTSITDHNLFMPLPPSNKRLEIQNSTLDAHVQRHHTGSEVVHIHVAEARVAHQLPQGFLARVH
eukprot:gene38919-51164_t